MDRRFDIGSPLPDEAALVAWYDELPLWSAPFGLRLLEAVSLRPGLVALDVGSGAGFPLVELAQRLGSSSRIVGVDVWGVALGRIRCKLQAYGIDNAVVSTARAEQLPLGDRTVDLIVSNNGFNNVAALEAAVAECARVARPGAQLVYTFNLPDTMHELYGVYDAILRERKLEEARGALAAHIQAKRKTVAFTADLFERNGFEVKEVVEDSFCLRFVDATAMFAHYFMRVAFVPLWLDLLIPDQREPVFLELERRLNAEAAHTGGLTLTIPFARCDCRRRGAAPGATL